MFTYETYSPGKTYGVAAYEVSHALCQKWHDLYGVAKKEDPSFAPLGIITLIQQEALNQIFHPRTKGNVQATQVFEIVKLPRRGTTVFTEASCLTKEIKKERFWVQLEFRTRDASGDLLFRSKNLIIVPN